MATNEVEICNQALSLLGAAEITSLTANSCKEDRLCNRFYAKLRDELLKKYPWNFARKETLLNRTDLYDTSDDYSDEVTITNVATSNPVVVTGANSYAAGMHVLITEVVGTDEINDLVFEVGAANAATFSLLGVDGGKYTAYTSGGTAVRVEALTAYRDGYTYDLPTDYLKARKLDSGDDFEISGTRLLTTDDAPVLIYTKAVTDTTAFTDEFEECLIARLVTALCMPILGAKTGVQMLPTFEAQYRQALKEAEKVNCSEEQKGQSYDDTWIAARA